MGRELQTDTREHLEYFPYGETWIHNKATSEQQSTPYKFTSKELDEETGLYYFEARYYDARMSRWISADPPISRGDYFPVPPVNDKAKEHNSKLPGMGGVFNSINLDAYQYAGQNPVRLIDPDGKFILGCGEEKQGTKVVKDIIEAGGQQGILFDKKSMDAFKNLERTLNRTQSAQEFAAFVIPFASAISGLGGKKIEQVVGLANAGGVTNSLALPESVKNALGALDNKNLGDFIKKLPVSNLHILSQQAAILGLEYQNEGNSNSQKLSKFWFNVSDGLDDMKSEAAR